MDATLERLYAGSDWLEKNLSYRKNKNNTISPLGKRVADLLGDLFLGIYHVNKEAMNVDWANDLWIEIILRDSGWSTFDYGNLTRFVLLCHEHNIRGTVEAAAYRYIRLIFHDTENASGRKHPTIEEAIKTHQQI
jgi:hypothetical protein